MNTSAHKVAIVTGASRGIGAAIARRLAQDGFAVAVNFARNAAEADKLVAALRAAGCTAHAIQADVASAADVRRLFDETERLLGTVDVLVNNAGVLEMGPIAEASNEQFEQHFAVNVRGTFNAMKEGGKRLAQGGRIVNFSSTLVALKLPGYGVYTATKAAVDAFTTIFAKELRGRDITVNAVAPGPVATELFYKGKSEAEVAQYASMAPLGRLGEPDDIARVVSFLAGPDGAWVNGQIVRANGGLA